jgi:hypothetical protein
MKVIPPTDKKLADGQEMTQFEATNCGGSNIHRLQVSIIVNNYNYWQKQIMFITWFLWVGLMSLPTVKLAIDWLFVPQSHPASLNWIGSKFKRILAIASLS